MFEKKSEDEIRSKCKYSIKNLEKWLRNLIDFCLTKEYGSEYYNFEDNKSNRLIKSSIVNSCNKLIDNEPNRYIRFIDATLFDDLIDIICKPTLYNKFFKIPLEIAFPVGREQAKSIFEKLITPRNYLAHSNTISFRQAEQVICYSHDIIESIKGYYESINMEKEYNVPSITSFSDSLGNKFYSNQFDQTFGKFKVISKNKLKKYKLYPGDSFQAEVKIDESFNPESYSIKWLVKGQSVFDIKEVKGKHFILEIEEKYINENFNIECYVKSNKEWHKYGKFDDQLRIIYQIMSIPPKTGQ